MRHCLALSLLLFSACGDPGDDRPDVLPSSGTVFYVDESELQPGEWEDDVAVGPCKHELKRECKVTLGVRNGIRTCAVGEQRCEGGKWRECKSNSSGSSNGHSKGADHGAAGAAGGDGQ